MRLVYLLNMLSSLNKDIIIIIRGAQMHPGAYCAYEHSFKSRHCYANF